MFDRHYADVRFVHIACAASSGLLFALRGVLRIRDNPLANHAALRIGSVAIDSALLLAAIVLTTIVRQYPFADAWLTVKVSLLLLYIFLGTLALKRARTPNAGAAAFAAALFTFAFIAGVAVTHQPLGWFALMR